MRVPILPRFAFGVVLAACFVIGCRGNSAPPEPPSTPPPPPSPVASADPERGELLFRSICGGYCHGIVEGKRDAPFLFDCDWVHGGSDQEIFDVISAGVPQTRMIGFGGKLPEGDADIWSLIAYIRSTSQCKAS